MKSYVKTKEKFKEEMSFDEFNFVVSGLKYVGNDRWRRIVDFTHVIKKPHEKELTDRVRTCIFFDDYMALRDMDTRLRYDKTLFNAVLDNVEEFTDEMLIRDKEFYENLENRGAFL